VKHVICWILIAIVIHLVPPFVGGIWYAGCGHRVAEQVWLDRVMAHMKGMRARCDDPEVCAVLDYTMARYNKIGGFNVMVAPCFSGPFADTIGLNIPLCPGLTVDPEVMTYPTHLGAVVVAHEAAHDYYPFFHPFVDSLTDKINAL
jgi:hypothetical protein